MSRALTWLFLPWFGQVGDAGVGTHEDVAWMKPSLQVQLFDFRQVDATQRSFGESIGWDQSQAEHTNPMDTVNGLGRQRERQRQRARQTEREDSCYNYHHSCSA